jgi:uncharacterized protein (DUF362 family)
MEAITRRNFLKQTAIGIGGLMLTKSLGTSIGLAQPPADTSRVVVVEHPEATDGVRIINPVNVQNMMDESIKRLTGQASVADAWASLLPDFKENHVVAIKVNVVNPFLPTHPAVVDAITSGLIAGGVLENNIIIYDAMRSNSWKQQLINAGYKYNAGDVGVRCIETNEKGWGYDWDNPVTILGKRMALSSVVTRCDYLINVPVLKWVWMPTSTLGFKNHYGSVSAPDGLHDDFPTACATLNSQEAIKVKTRLIVIDALLGCWSSHINPPNFAPNSLIMSRDPVAADYVGTQMLEEERARYNQPPGNVPFLEKAADMGLGTDDPEKMELIRLELKVPEKEEKSVEAKDRLTTNWGKIKHSR